MSAGSHKDIALHYFRKVDDAVWECNECKVRRKQMPGSGYNNLYTHITAKHTDCREKVLSKNSKLTFVASPRTVNIYGWMEWVVMNGLPFSFVQEKHVNLSVIQTLFKSLLEDYPQMSHYLGTEEGSLTHNPAFELSIVNIIDGVTLSPAQEAAITVFN